GAPLSPEVRLARGDQSGGLRASQDVLVGEFVVFDPMARVVPRFRVLDRLEALDDEADRGVADRVCRRLESGAMRSLQEVVQVRGRADEHSLLAGKVRIRIAERRGVRAEGPIGEDRARTDPTPS